MVPAATETAWSSVGASAAGCLAGGELGLQAWEESGGGALGLAAGRAGVAKACAEVLPWAR